MERTNIFLPFKMKAALRRLSKSSGLPVAELVRRAVDAMLLCQPNSK
jgi:predicted DNA-binding protein